MRFRIKGVWISEGPLYLIPKDIACGYKGSQSCRYIIVLELTFTKDHSGVGMYDTIT